MHFMALWLVLQDMVARQVHIVKHIDVDYPSMYQTDKKFAIIINQFEAYKKLNKNVKTSCNKRKGRDLTKAQKNPKSNVTL